MGSNYYSELESIVLISNELFLQTTQLHLLKLTRSSITIIDYFSEYNKSNNSNTQFIAIVMVYWAELRFVTFQYIFRMKLLYNNYNANRGQR